MTAMSVQRVTSLSVSVSLFTFVLLYMLHNKYQFCKKYLQQKCRPVDLNSKAYRFYNRRVNYHWNLIPLAVLHVRSSNSHMPDSTVDSGTTKAVTE